MKNKGFTLIELLAVIIILAIISLITIPNILNIVNNTKNSSKKISFEMYINDIKKAVNEYQLAENKVPTAYKDIEKYITYDAGDLDCAIKINKDSSIYVGDCKIKAREVDYEYGKPPVYKNGEIIYYDVIRGRGCTNYNEENSNINYNGINGEGNQNSCLKFYAFNDDGGKNINLLLDHNTTATKEWINKEDFESSNGKITNSISQDGACKYGGICYGNNVGPVTLLKQLYEDTKLWSDNIITPKNYTLNQLEQVSEAEYVIEYSKTPLYEGANTPYKARLITVQEIAEITGADKILNWNELNSNTEFYLDGASGNDQTWNTPVANSNNKSEYHWLYDRTKDCLVNGCLIEDSLTYGYWSATSSATTSDRAWMVKNTGNIEYAIFPVTTDSQVGIRPVITISKLDI